MTGYISDMTDLLLLFDGFYPDFQMLHTDDPDLCTLGHWNTTHRAPVLPMDQDLPHFATLVFSFSALLLYLPI
jgi:hypothetical protein